MSTEEKTSKELIEKAEQEAMLDGFDTYGDELDRRLLQGTQIKFTNAYTWVTRAGEEMPTDKEFIAVDLKRVEARWTTDKNAPPQTRVLLPGEKFRDIRKLNEETPKSEWREYNGQLKGPWENQHYLLPARPADEEVYLCGQHHRRQHRHLRTSPTNQRRANGVRP